MWHKTFSTIGHCYCSAKRRTFRAKCDLHKGVSSHIDYSIHCTGYAARSTVAGLSWHTLWCRIYGCCLRAKRKFRKWSVWRCRKSITSVGTQSLPTIVVPTGLLLLLFCYWIQKSCQSEELPSRWSECFVWYTNDINNSSIKRIVWPNYDDTFKQRSRL